MLRKIFILWLLFCSAAIGRSPLAEALVRNTIQAELRINSSWEHYHILRDYLRDRDNPDRDFSKELRGHLSKKELTRVKQLYIQMQLHEDSFHPAARHMGLNAVEVKKVSELLKTIGQKEIKKRQDEMTFRLVKEDMQRLFSEEELDEICGTELQTPVVLLYTDVKDFHAIGADWIRCLNKTSKNSLGMTLGQVKKLKSFTTGPAKEFLKTEKAETLRKYEENLSTYGMVAVREALTKARKEGEFDGLSKEDRRKKYQVIAKKIMKDKTPEAEAFKYIDPKAQFIVDFMNEVLTPEQLLKVKQRLVQSAMIRGNQGVFLALRQVGYDFYESKREEVLDFSRDVNFTDRQAIRDYVRWCAYKDAFEAVIGERKFESLVGERHVFSGPFGDMPSLKSDLFQEEISFLEKQKNPRRG